MKLHPSVNARKLFIFFSLLAIFLVDLFLGYLVFQIRQHDGITMGFGFVALLGVFIVLPCTLGLLLVKPSRTECIVLAVLGLIFLTALSVS